MVARAAPARTGTPLRIVPEATSSRSPLRPIARLFEYVLAERRHALLTIFFGAAGFALSFVYPWIIGSVVDVLAAPSGSGPDRAGRVTHLAELAVLTAIGHAIVVYGRGHFNVHLGNRVVSRIRRELFEHLQRLSVRFFTKERTGSILARVVHDVHEATALVYTGIIVAVLDVAQLALAFALLVAINGKLALACSVLFPLYAIAFAVMNPRVRQASERMNDAFSGICGNLAEQLAGQALIKTYTAERREARRFGHDVRCHHELVVAQSHVGHLVAGFGELLVHLGTTIVVGFGGWLALRGELTPGEMTRFLGYMLIMFGPVRRFAELNITYQTSLSAMRRVFRVFQISPGVEEPPLAREEPPAVGHVAFQDVRFRYDDRSDEARVRIDVDPATDEVRLSSPPSSRNAPWILDGVSFQARPGERIAIVGPSGAGKTTLVSLLPRLYDVASGHVLIDGVDVRRYSLRALRSAIAIVQQDSFLFTGSIRENIAYGRPDAPFEEVVAAAVAAHVDDFVRTMPNGYDTVLGERGVNLSGGQRQRISIARAILKAPRILVLDEATSSLDTESESIVQKALERLMRGRTCLVVAHRLSTIRNADRIVVLSHGRIVEVGTHDELVERGGVYAQLVSVS